MEQEKILEKILEEVGGIKTQISELKSDVGTLKSDVGTLKSDVGTLKSDVGTLTGRVDTLTAEFVDLKEYVKEELVTREEFNEKLDGVAGNVDSFIKLHTTLDQELVMLRHKYDRHEERIAKLEQNFGMAAA